MAHLWLPRSGAWAAAHGCQEVLFTSRFRALGTAIDMSRLRAGAGGPTGQLVELDLPSGERWADLSDAELVALLDEELGRVAPGLPASRDHRVLRWRDFTAAEPGSEARRPHVATALPNLVLAGDWVRASQECFYMERCVVTAWDAVNHLLDLFGVARGRLVHLPSETPSLPLAALRRLASVQA